jgi:hypothetical protein
MWRRLRRLDWATATVLVGLTAVVGSVGAANTPTEQRLLERIRVLEERLNKLEQVESAPKPTGPAESADMERLIERLSDLEERLDRLDRTDVIKKKVEYICPDGEILDEPPPGGRCPNAGPPQVRETMIQSTMLRRESISEKIESALQDAEGKKVAIGGSARGIAQQVLNGRKGEDNLYGSGALDLTFLARPMARTTFFADLEAIAGPGPDRKLGSLSRLNADVETLGDQDEKLTLREVWLGFQLFNDRLNAFVGKLDPTNYFDRNAFANDETTQFLNAALVNNAMLKQPANGPGLATQWDPARDLHFSLGVHGTNDFDKDLWSGPFVIGEVGYHSARLLDGNYRLWARVGRLPDDPDRQAWGMGVSLDQLLTPQLGVFLRAGFSDADGISQTSYAASTGLRFTSPWASRPRDRAGAGYSFISEPVGDEHLVELYYNFFLTERLSFIGNVEWLISGPNQVSGGTNHNVVVPGVRAVVSF